MNRHDFIAGELLASAETQKQILAQCNDAIERAVDMLVTAYRSGHKTLWCGNGGSAADCQHLATEFVIRLSREITRPGLPAIALTTDTSMLTAGANDLGYDHVFARAIEALGAEGDILVGISTSGNSPSVNNAFRKARERKLLTIGLLGSGGGNALPLVDLAIIVPSRNTQRIQEGHITIGHILCGLTERELYA